MVYTPRQIAVRARETAALLLRALEHERLAARFVNVYAAEHDRAACTAYPGQYRETVALLEREALLTMSAWVEREMPKRLGAQPAKRGKVAGGARGQLAGKRCTKGITVRHDGAGKSAGKTAEPEASESFRVEYLVSLGQALEWNDAELDDFCRDLELYKKLERAVPLPLRRRQKREGGTGGPFADRCGVLLDPSMFDHARRAAGKFQGELRATTEAVLRKVFSRQRAN
jgi:hypothetical protein